MPPPPQNSLSASQIQTGYTWISNGAQDNACTNTCDTTSAVTYSATVWPIIQTYCLGCHSGPNAQKGQYLENYTDISTVASNGTLLGVIKGLSGYNQMPPSGPIPSCQIAQIEKWVNTGFSNNRLAQ